MNKENVIALSAATAEDVKFAQDISNKIVAAQASALDKLVMEIKANVVEAPNADDKAIEQYMMQLVLVLCAINPQVDSFSFYDVISSEKATLAYNEKYAESQMQATASSRKLTKDDHQQYAENNTIDERMLNLIYSRSVKILKDKVDGGYELLDVLKRILKHHEQETFYDKQTRTLLS